MKLALAGDTMLGRRVGERLQHAPARPLFSTELIDVVHEADLVVLNLECAISDRGERWPDPAKPYFFRAPRSAVEVLRDLRVDCVTLANNHSLDYGPTALLDTCRHLDDAGIARVGAGADEAAARAPAVMSAAGMRIGVLGVTDHPRDYAAGPDRPGVAYADLRHGPPTWLLDTVQRCPGDLVMVSAHWGPNMVTEPASRVRAAAPALRAAGAGLVVGHSAHVFHGVGDRVLYDLGDFIDDYAIDPVMRNDLGLLFLVTVVDGVPTALEAVPLALDFCFTRLADADEAAWIHDRFRRACAPFGTDVAIRGRRLVVTWDPPPPSPASRGDRGHAVRPHTADVLLDAWGPDPAACLEEAVDALVATYARPASAAVAAVQGRPVVHLAPAPLDEQLLTLLDEVLYVLDTDPALPVGARVTPSLDGGFDVEVLLAAPDAVEHVGSIPKAVARSELRVERHGNATRCSFLVDV
jgi:poly-gamma-glutamate synthesis protein (capsule biosynthesis protein)